MSYVIVARDYKDRIKVIGPHIHGGWLLEANAQRELDFIRPLLGSGVVDARVISLDPVTALKERVA